jgi:hypothetical protein
VVRARVAGDGGELWVLRRLSLPFDGAGRIEPREQFLEPGVRFDATCDGFVERQAHWRRLRERQIRNTSH